MLIIRITWYPFNLGPAFGSREVLYFDEVANTPVFRDGAFKFVKSSSHRFFADDLSFSGYHIFYWNISSLCIYIQRNVFSCKCLLGSTHDYDDFFCRCMRSAFSRSFEFWKTCQTHQYVGWGEAFKIFMQWSTLYFIYFETVKYISILLSEKYIQNDWNLFRDRYF